MSLMSLMNLIRVIYRLCRRGGRFESAAPRGICSVGGYLGFGCFLVAATVCKIGYRGCNVDRSESTDNHTEYHREDE